MHDREIVAAIVAGDPAGLADAWDRYAPALHSYCRSLLAEPATDLTVDPGGLTVEIEYPPKD